MEVCLSVCPSVYDYDQRKYYYYYFDATKANYKHILQNAVKFLALTRLTTTNLMLQEHTTNKIFKFLLKSQRKYGLLQTILEIYNCGYIVNMQIL